MIGVNDRDEALQTVKNRHKITALIIGIMIIRFRLQLACF